jgi:sortase A
VTDDEQEPASGALHRLEDLDEGGLWRRKRVSRWDRVVDRDLRWAIGLAGRILIVIGLLMFGFVAYQLWGTGIETARAQNSLENEFEDLAAQLDRPVVTPTTSSAVPATTSTTPTTRPPSTRPPTTRRPTTTVATTVAPTTTAPAPPIEIGDALGYIEIPRIDLKFYLVAGVGTEELKKGVGHYTETPMPGQLGNSAFAGHRTTYGHPFFNIDQVQPGDEIIVTTLDGRFVYRMTSQQIVSPNDYQVVTTTDPTIATLTLTSCHPRYSANERIVVTASLDTSVSAPIDEPLRSYHPAETAAPPTTASTSTTTTTSETTTPSTDTSSGTARPTSTTTTTTSTTEPSTVATTPVAGGPQTPSHPDAPSEEAADAFSHGWFSDGAAWPHVLAWSGLVALVTVGAFLLARRFRRLWVGFLVGAVPFLFALYFFYQNVNRLLPSAL